MRIAIANSVGIDKDGYYIIHSPSRWSWGQKNNKNAFTYYPWELAYTSSLLKQKTDFEIKFYDGCLRKWDIQAYFEKLSEFKPHFIVFESSVRTIETDKILALKCKQTFGAKIIMTGAYPTAFPEETQKWADFVCIGEYEYSVLDIVRSEKNIAGVYPNSFRDLLDINTLPFPEDNDVSRFEYAKPGEPNCEFTEIQMYASRGCPLRCNFCVCGNLYYKKPNWRPRSIENIISEIIYLKNKYSVMEGIFFDEEMHNGSKKFILGLTEAIIKNKLNYLKFNAMCGYYNMDEEMLCAMKNAGYYKLRIGIETANREVAKEIGMLPKFDLVRLENVLKTAKKIGLKIYGTFTIGAKGSTFEADLETGRLLQQYVAAGLIKDVQVSINTPQPGTPFYKWAEKNNYLLTKDWLKYDGGLFSVVDRPEYPAERVEAAFQNVLSMYDKGLEKREYNILKAKFIEQLKKIDFKIQNLILLRSNRMWQINIFIEAVKAFDENIKIDIIGQSIVKDSLTKNNRIKKIFYYDDGFFNFEKFIKNQELVGLKSKYTAAVVFYNNETGSGYEEVQKIAGNISENYIEVFSLGKIVLKKG